MSNASGSSGSEKQVQCEVLPIPDRPYAGFVAYDAKDPDSKFPPIEPLRPPKGAPNVLIVLIDDVGFGASSVFGGPCRAPTAHGTPEGNPIVGFSNPEFKRVLAREMEVYAGFFSFTDYHIGRLIDALDRIEALDNTLIYYIIGDNGASAEGTLQDTCRRLIDVGFFLNRAAVFTIVSAIVIGAFVLAEWAANAWLNTPPAPPAPTSAWPWLSVSASRFSTFISTSSDLSITSFSTSGTRMSRRCAALRTRRLTSPTGNATGSGRADGPGAHERGRGYDPGSRRQGQVRVRDRQRTGRGWRKRFRHRRARAWNKPIDLHAISRFRAARRVRVPDDLTRRPCRRAHLWAEARRRGICPRRIAGIAGARTWGGDGARHAGESKRRRYGVGTRDASADAARASESVAHNRERVRATRIRRTAKSSNLPPHRLSRTSRIASQGWDR